MRSRRFGVQAPQDQAVLVDNIRSDPACGGRACASSTAAATGEAIIITPALHRLDESVTYIIIAFTAEVQLTCNSIAGASSLCRG
jgi:hypothetical protein